MLSDPRRSRLRGTPTAAEAAHTATAPRRLLGLRAGVPMGEPSRGVRRKGSADSIRATHPVALSACVERRQLILREPHRDHLGRCRTPTGTTPPTSLQPVDVIAGLGLRDPRHDLPLTHGGPMDRLRGGRGSTAWPSSRIASGVAHVGSETVHIAHRHIVRRKHCGVQSARVGVSGPPDGRCRARRHNSGTRRRDRH